MAEDRVDIMPRYDDDDWKEDKPDWGADEEDLEIPPEERGEPVVTCPYCRKQIHEQSPRCPYCERYISEEDTPPSRKPWWIIIGALLALYVVYSWISRP
jgi:transposase-like protein